MLKLYNASKLHIIKVSDLVGLGWNSRFCFRRSSHITDASSNRDHNSRMTVLVYLILTRAQCGVGQTQMSNLGTVETHDFPSGTQWVSGWAEMRTYEDLSGFLLLRSTVQFPKKASPDFKCLVFLLYSLQGHFSYVDKHPPPVFCMV